MRRETAVWQLRSPRQHANGECEHQTSDSPLEEAATNARQREGVTGEANGRKRKKHRKAAATAKCVTSEKPLDDSPVAGTSQHTRQEASVRTAAHGEANGTSAAQHSAATGKVQSTGQKSARQAGRPTPALDRMRERLQGGRFRWLNEQMYSQPGEQSYRIMQVISEHGATMLHEC